MTQNVDRGRARGVLCALEVVRFSELLVVRYHRMLECVIEISVPVSRCKSSGNRNYQSYMVCLKSISTVTSLQYLTMWCINGITYANSCGTMHSICHGVTHDPQHVLSACDLLYTTTSQVINHIQHIRVQPDEAFVTKTIDLLVTNSRVSVTGSKIIRIIVVNFIKAIPGFSSPSLIGNNITYNLIIL